MRRGGPRGGSLEEGPEHHDGEDARQQAGSCTGAIRAGDLPAGGDHQGCPSPSAGEGRLLTAIAVLGPTASGKSGVAIQIAEHFGGEIVSVDSMQVYRGMDIGTAKATPAMQERVPHHLLDLCEPSHDLSVAEFQREGRSVLSDLERRGVVPVICGGSGLHFRALVDPLEFPPGDPVVRAEIEALDPADAKRRLRELDPEVDSFVDMANQRRVIRALEIALVTQEVPSFRASTSQAEAVRSYEPLLDFVAVGLDPGEGLAGRIESRFNEMLREGLLTEVESLQPKLGKLARQAVGYKELLPVAAGDMDLESGSAQAIQATKALAKRQRTFFRRDPRILWLPWVERAGGRNAIDYLEASWTS